MAAPAADAAAELLRRRAIRRDLGTWCEHALDPLGQTPAAHHRLIIRELQAVARGENDRLMLFLPPGSAKSTYASILFPAWFLAQQPNLTMIGASHTATLAEDFSRRVQGFVREHTNALGYGLTRESAELWTTTNGGRYRAAGVGGPITGSRADLALVDDPVKSRAAADSERAREVTWNWFRADLLTRLRPGGRIVLIQTRWHEADLAGQILMHEPDRWRVIKLPALAEDNDPLGRTPGQPLWPEWESGDMLADKRSTLGERDWSSLFQQDPRPLDGNLFKTAKLAAIEAAPVGGSIVRAWDLASTAKIGTADPDWTVGVKMLRTAEGRFVVLDVVRFRGGPEDVQAGIINTAALDGRAIKVRIPQDPGQAGVAQVLDLTKRLAGYNVVSERPTGPKETRAAPFASQVNVGNVALVKASWNAAFVEELRGFPSARHDDQVDAASDAFAELIAPPKPTKITSLRL